MESRTVQVTKEEKICRMKRKENWNGKKGGVDQERGHKKERRKKRRKDEFKTTLSVCDLPAWY